MTGEALRSTVNHLFSVIKARSSSTELVFLCPEPGCGDETGNRSVNVKNGKTSCWRCNKGGDFIRWARRLGYSLEDEKPVATPLDEIDMLPHVVSRDSLPPVRAIRLPEGFVACSDHPGSVYTELIAELAERKNLTIEDFIEAGVGFTRTHPRWEPYAIFPVTEFGRVVYYQGRTYVDVDGEPTKLFPSRNEVAYGSKYWVYNIDEIKRVKPRTVIVVESILNVLSLRWYLREQNVTDAVPVAVFKHYVSQPQAQKILAHRFVEELCLLYDHDASHASWDKAPLMSDQVRLSIAEMPLGSGGRRSDPNDDVAAAFSAFTDRKIYTQNEAILRQAESGFLRRTPHRPDDTPVSHVTFDVLEGVERTLEQAAKYRRRASDDV